MFLIGLVIIIWKPIQVNVTYYLVVKVMKLYPGNVNIK